MGWDVRGLPSSQPTRRSTRRCSRQRLGEQPDHSTGFCSITLYASTDESKSSLRADVKCTGVEALAGQLVQPAYIGPAHQPCPPVPGGGAAADCAAGSWVGGGRWGCTARPPAVRQGGGRLCVHMWRARSFSLAVQATSSLPLPSPSPYSHPTHTSTGRPLSCRALGARSSPLPRHTTSSPFPTPPHPAICPSTHLATAVLPRAQRPFVLLSYAGHHLSSPALQNAHHLCGGLQCISCCRGQQGSLQEEVGREGRGQGGAQTHDSDLRKGAKRMAPLLALVR